MAKQQQTRSRIDALREQIGASKHELRQLGHQMRSPSEVRTLVEAQVEQWAEQARDGLRQELREVSVWRRSLNMEVHVSDASPTIPASARLGPLLALMLGADTLKERILAQLDAVPECPDTPERLARIEEIGRELDDLESEEERLICEAEERGEVILRRGDARPEIVLGEFEPITPQVDPAKYLVSKSNAPHRAGPSPYVGSSRD